MAGTRRQDHSRGHSYFLDGRKVMGVTTVLKEGFPMPALVGWAAKATAQYAIDNWDDLSELGGTERYERVKNGRNAGLRKAGERGTQVHSLAFAMAHRPGVHVVVPEELEGHVDSWLRFSEDWDVREELVEVVVLHRDFHYMGTLDSIATLADGRRWLLDYKTAGSGIYDDHALQLAGYRNAPTYIGADGQEHDLPQVDACGVVWLRADGYDLIPFDVGDREWKTFLHCLGVARWRADVKDERRVVKGEALTPPTRDEAERTVDV